MPRLVVWFSCGAASAVAAKLCLAKYADEYEIAVARCIVANEHPDNDRFCDDCEEWFGQEIIKLKSPFYRSCWDIWRLEKFIVSSRGASNCTKKMKIQVRKMFEDWWQPDFQAYGYTVEEKKRVEKFLKFNPNMNLITPLIDANLKKSDCLAMTEKAGIELPAMYKLGFNNNNCVGCPKGGRGYWNHIRAHFPEIFRRMATLEREINSTIFLQGGKKLFLDELDPCAGKHVEPVIDCSLFCYAANERLEG